MADTSKEWIRTHYDKNGDCRIDRDEMKAAINDYYAGIITNEQLKAVNDAFHDGTNLCGETPTIHTVRFIVPSGSTVRVIK